MISRRRSTTRLGSAGYEVTRALLLSGGHDSMAIAYRDRPEWAITVDYGQIPARAESRASADLCKELGIQHIILKVDCKPIGVGDLAGTEPLSISPLSVWWPFRNQLLVTLAASRMIREGVRELWIGTVRGDDCFADGKREFIEGMSRILSIQEGEMTLVAPGFGLTSLELIRSSGIPRSVLALAHSCHVSNFACGQCRGCLQHLATLEALGYRNSRR
jgi:7-cyano-7-deazaguanine synthase